MSDQQPSPPPKPKPGSLRDRIAAFEKSSTAPASAGQAPVPRPKPSGFASWKPKVPSPPSSPSSTSIDHAASSSSKATGGMSASDAKESITKGGGGSLKDRMAALQGKGAFGAPSPPLAPKPAVEKPRWKPPPAVSPPIDSDDHDGAVNTTGNEPADSTASTFDRTKSPPISRQSLDLSKAIAEGEETYTTEPVTSTGGDIEGRADPEEEERQRRAAIAARMARLGGARLGMAPPVVAKKPSIPTRKSTREDVPTQEDHEGPSKRQSITSDGNVSSPPNVDQGTESPHAQPQSDVEISPNRKNSESASILSVDSTESRSPPSMPVPTVPRRAGPPRKKPVKPPPEVVEEAIVTPSVISAVDEEHKAVEKAEEAVISVPEHEDKDQQAAIHDEPQSIDPDIQHKPAEEPVAESKPASSGEHEHDVDTIAKDHTEDDDKIDYPDEHSDYDDTSVPNDDHQHLQQDDDHHVDAELQPSFMHHAIGAEEEEEDDAEEDARRKRVAERLAKMGGINPFAAPLLSPPLRPSSQAEFGYDPPVVSSLPVSPTRPDMPPKRDSLPSHEVAEPHSPPVVEPKVEEERGEREIFDEIEDQDSDYAEEGSFEETRIRKEESSLSASELSPPSLPLQQAKSVPVRDPVPQPPIPGSARPHVQIQQYGRHDVREEPSAMPRSRLPDPPVSREGASSSPVRPAQPPRRIVPQVPEEQEQEEEEAGTDDEVVPSHLFVRSPARGSISHQPGRGGQRYEAEDDGSDDTPALPVLQRRPMEVPPGRPIPPPPPRSHLRHHLSTSSSDAHEHDSDHDGQVLPVRPRHTTVSSPPTSPTPVLPRPTPRRSVPSAPENEESLYGMPLVAVSEPEPGEILDEEEGDPIDPAFHSPSRQASVGNMRASAQDDTSGLPVQVSSVPPANVEKREEAQPQQEQDQTRRQTLAERMAKLGGIKFGAAPIPAAVNRSPPIAPGVDEEGGSHSHAEHQPQADSEHVEQPLEPSEEEEERARKERIAAKLAGMGGMRIGMLPMGMGPQRTHVLRDDNVAPPSPTRAIPPPPPPTLLPTHDTDSERTSDDGVKVEVEESEMEEVDYADAAEEIEETPPPVPFRGGRRRESNDVAGEFEAVPPVPFRGGRRRESTDKATSPPPPHIPGSRPPVPVALPTRRASVKTFRSTGSGDFGMSPTRSTSSHIFPHSEYVIVDEPEETPPSRRASRITPVRPPPNPLGVSQTSDSQNISSHWELPSIPTADLSLSSWTDAGEPTSPTVSSPPPPPPLARQPSAVSHKRRPSELQLSADELMAVWGRVGVQVCEVATTLFENSKKTLIGDGTYAGFVTAVLAGVPNAATISVASGEYGYLVYAQNGTSVQKRVSEIMPGDIVEIHEGKLKGHKGIQTYHQNVGGSGEALLGVVGEFEAKKSKIRVFHANQHVGQQTVESVSYRLEDLKSGTVKVYRVLEE